MPSVNQWNRPAETSSYLVVWSCWACRMICCRRTHWSQRLEDNFWKWVRKTFIWTSVYRHCTISFRNLQVVLCLVQMNLSTFTFWWLLIFLCVCVKEYSQTETSKFNFIELNKPRKSHFRRDYFLSKLTLLHNYHFNTYAHLVLSSLQIHLLIVSCEMVLSEIFLHRAEKEKSEATESRI